MNKLRQIFLDVLTGGSEYVLVLPDQSNKLDKLDQAVKDLFLELIGEDHVLFGHGEDWEGAKSQNELKAELRQKVEKL